MIKNKNYFNLEEVKFKSWLHGDFIFLLWMPWLHAPSVGEEYFCFFRNSASLVLHLYYFDHNLLIWHPNNANSDSILKSLKRSTTLVFDFLHLTSLKSSNWLHKVLLSWIPRVTRDLVRAWIGLEINLPCLHLPCTQAIRSFWNLLS